MINNKYKELLANYKDYLKSTEALAVYIAKAYVNDIDTENKWVDILSSDTWKHKSGETGFNYLIVEIFDKKDYPNYPIKDEQMSEYEYRQICKALTWKVSHEDINNQRQIGVKGQIFLIIVQLFNKNRGKKVIIEKPFWNEEYGGFDYTGKVPTTTKKIEKDMEPDWDYFIKICKKITESDVERIEKYFHDYILPKIHEKRSNLIDWYFTEYELNKKTINKDKHNIRNKHKKSNSFL